MYNFIRDFDFIFRILTILVCIGACITAGAMVMSLAIPGIGFATSFFILVALFALSPLSK